MSNTLLKILTSLVLKIVLSRQIDSYIPVTKAKTKLLDVIRTINDSEDIIAITKNGIPKAVIMSMERYETMRETMVILGNKEMMEQIRHPAHGESIAG